MSRNQFHKATKLHILSCTLKEGGQTVLLPGAGEMTQLLRALSTLPEDQTLGPSTSQAAHDFSSNSRGSNTLSILLQAPELMCTDRWTDKQTDRQTHACKHACMHAHVYPHLNKRKSKKRKPSASSDPGKPQNGLLSGSQGRPKALGRRLFLSDKPPHVLGQSQGILPRAR